MTGLTSFHQKKRFFSEKIEENARADQSAAHLRIHEVIPQRHQTSETASDPPEL